MSSTKLKFSKGFKGSTKGPQSIALIIEQSNLQLSPEKARLCTSDTRPYREHQIMSAHHTDCLIVKQNLHNTLRDIFTLLKKCQIYEKLGILGDFRQNQEKLGAHLKN